MKLAFFLTESARWGNYNVYSHSLAPCLNLCQDTSSYTHHCFFIISASVNTVKRGKGK